MVTPLFLPDILATLNLGQQILVVATLVIVLLYLLRSRKMAAKATSTFNLAWFMAVAVIVSAVVAIYLGWVDPFPDQFRDDVITGAEALYETLKGLVRDVVP